ncbi:hypothetical protein ABZ128_03360 [Streptomyces sp. NPDC006326]
MRVAADSSLAQPGPSAYRKSCESQGVLILCDDTQGGLART